MAKMKNLTWKQRAGIGIGIIVILYCCVAFYYSKGFVFGTKINGENVSGMTEEEVIRLFQNKAENYSLTLKERKGKKKFLQKIRFVPSLKAQMRFGRLRKNRVLFYGSRDYSAERLMMTLQCFLTMRALLKRLIRSWNVWMRRRSLRERMQNRSTKTGSL